MTRNWLDRPIYVVEDIHPDGSRTYLYPRQPRRRGWWLMLLLTWDGLVQRGPQRAPYCTHCGELLHRDGYCTPYPDKREDIL